MIDWGCGQGIGTIAFLEYFSSFNNINKIILIEPSVLAIKKAEKLIEESSRFKNSSIQLFLIEKDINTIKTNDFPGDIHNAINIFSNILDVKTINVKHISGLISKIMQKRSYCLCVSPNYYRSTKKIDEFYQSLKPSSANNIVSYNYDFYIEEYDFHFKKIRNRRRKQYSRAFTIN